MANLALADLVLPYVFRGENLGPVHAALSALRVVTVETAVDGLGVALRGHCEVNGRLELDPAAGTLTASVDEATPAHDPSRSNPIFDLADTNVDFELVVPRQGSAIVQAGQTSFTAQAAPAAAVLGDWQAAGPPDFPSTGFVLDLVVNAPKLRPPFLHPAKVNDIGVLEPDPSVQEVALTLPRLRFRITHGNAIGSQLELSLASAGVSSLDDPGSMSVSEMISMEPPYAYVGAADSRIVGFGFRSATLDLDRDYTPAAMQAKTGIGDDWTGLYLPEARVFVAPDGLRNLAFECGARELLIGVGKTAGVWGDFEAALVQQGGGQVVLNPRFDGNGRSYAIERLGSVSGVEQSKARVPEQSTLVVDVSGGRTPYHRTVKINGTTQTLDHTMFALDLSAGDHTAVVEIEVTTGSGSATPAKMRIEVSRLQDTPVLTVPGQPIVTGQAARITAQSGFTFVLEHGTGDGVTIRSQPPVPELMWTTSGSPAVGPTAALSTSIVASTTRQYTVSKPAVTGTTDLDYYFFFDCPGGGSSAMATQPATDKLHQTWSPGAQDPGPAYAPHFNALPNGTTITISGDASFEGDLEKLEYNTKLAWRRAQAVRAHLASRYPSKNFDYDVKPDLVNPQSPTQVEMNAWAADVGWTTNIAPIDRQHWRAEVTIPANTPAQNGSVDIERPAPTTTPTTVTIPPPDPPVPETSPPPDWFRSVKVMVRIVDSQLIALQLDLEVDMQTFTEDRLQGQMAALPAGTAPLPQGRTLDHGAPVGPANPADGITAFRVLVQTDPSTGRWDTLLMVGADPADTDGLFHFGWIPQVDPMPADKDLALTFLGSYLSFWPLLAAVPPVDSFRNAAEGRDGAVVPAVLSGAALAVPGVVAVLPWFAIERVILYGAEYFHTQRDGGFTGTLLFDVEMDWSINLLDIVKIRRDNPLKVRYKAIGLQLTNRDVPPGSPPNTPAPDRWDLLPVFDASRGYTIDVAGGGGGMEIGDPLGRILRIAGARLSRSNPMTLEVDIALGVDLGVVSVDQASVRAYLDGSAPPELTALSASVDIPGALIGSGYMRIGNAPNGTKTIGGQLDLTLRPVNVRVAAAVEVANIQDGGRTATGVYVGLNIVLPAGIPLGSTGLGIFGFRGIFGMHYRRTEITGPNASVPALEWLKASGGQPHLLKAPGGGPVLWEPQIDNWAFGIGILIGTMEGGVLINLDGTFLLELPGPRVLIMMNARILSLPPSMDGLGQEGGILAVIEITPEHFLIGVLISWEIEDLIKIVIPVEAVFPFGADSQKWHIYLGARSDYGPSVEVDVLGIVKGTGYLMFRGDGLDLFDTGHGSLPLIKGFGIGVGVGASFTWGDRSSGLYLFVGGGMDAVVGFNPFILAGNIWIAGELHLWIVSIGADASLDVVVAEQAGGDLAVYIHGKACGHVDFFFFEVSGCVEITLSGPEKSAAIPALVEKLSLQSRSPALAQGTGVDKGVDVSLGTARKSGSYPGDSHVPRVPIDAIPVISFMAPPSPDGTVTIGGLGTTLTPAPGLDSYQAAERSGERYRYKVAALLLERVKGNGQVETVTLNGTNAPATWWTINPSEEPSPTAQLALLTYQVTPATKAIEYHDKLVEDVIRHWGSVCDPVAGPAEVLWTFKLEPLGPSLTGWELEGIAWPDDPGTKRSTAPDTTLDVSEPWRTGDPTIDGLRGVVPAIVIGGAVECHGKQREPEIGGILRAALAAHLADDAHAPSRGATRASSVPIPHVPAAARAPHIVVGGVGAVDRPGAGRSGAALADDDPVRDLIGVGDEALPVRISPAFHGKATAAAPGLRELVAIGHEGPAFGDLLTRVSAGTEISNLALAHGLARTVTDAPARAIAVAAVDRAANGARCAVKVLLSPLADFGEITNFDDDDLVHELEPKVKDHVRPDTKFANLIRIESGPFDSMDLLVLVSRKVITKMPLVAVVYDDSGNVLDEVVLTPADLLGAGAVLPPRWTDTSGPWAADIADLVQWSQQSPLQPAHLEVPGHLDAAYVELGCSLESGDRDTLAQQVYALAAVSMVSGAEVARAQWDENQSSQQKDRLVEATGPNASNCALLKADSRYRLTVSWFAERLKADGTVIDTRASAGTPETDVFWFHTDKIVKDPTDTASTGITQPGAKLIFDDTAYDAESDVSTPAPVPVRLDPWVLVSLPADNERHWFGHEAVRVVFNTPDVDRIFGEYGKELRMRFEAANGQHPGGTPNTPIPLAILGEAGTLTDIDGVVLPPWHMAVKTMLETPKPGAVSPDDTYAPCIDFDGTSITHSETVSDVPLDPFMDYMLDIEVVPSGAPDSARGPLVFRRHFTTGAFGTLEAFAFSIKATLTSARFCPTDTFRDLLTAHGTHPLGSQIDDHLLAHQLEPLQVPDEPRVVVFWEQSGASLPQPAAILIDATEPLSRSRNYPKLVVDSSTADGAQRWVLAPREWLTLDTGGDAGVVRDIVYTPGLQRAFIVLEPNQRGKHLIVDLVAPGMPDLPFLDQGTLTHPVLDVVLAKAPWEED